jgi:hypothetical protein
MIGMGGVFTPACWEGKSIQEHVYEARWTGDYARDNREFCNLVMSCLLLYFPEDPDDRTGVDSSTAGERFQSQLRFCIAQLGGDPFERLFSCPAE